MDKLYRNITGLFAFKHLTPVGVVFLSLSLSLLGLLSSLGSMTVLAQSPDQPAYDEKLRLYLEAQMKAYHIPGMSIAIVRDGQVEYLAGLGVANSAGHPVTPETPFLLASVSKSITALAVLQLVEAGRLDLDNPVQKYLPWFEVAGGEAAAIKVADLLYQTSGLSELGGIRANLAPDSPSALEDGVRLLAQERLQFPPGESFEYSNLNYNVLGLLVQEVSGLSYEDYIRQNIFVPLGMNRSHTSLAAARAEGASNGHYPFFGIPLVLGERLPYTRGNLPGAGLWSSASDMSRYLIAHLNGGQVGDTSILSATGIDSLHQPGYMFNDQQGYAMGWTRASAFMDRPTLETSGSELLDRGDLPVLFHEGDWLGYKAMAFLVPDLDYGVILLMNGNDPTVTSAQRFFAWDVTLIATGGEAQYFPPAESFLARHSRWIFGFIILLLAAGLAWTLSSLRKNNRGGVISRTSTLLHVLLAFIPSTLLIAYIFLKLLPDQATDLRLLIHFAPDLALLLILFLILATAWMVSSLILFGRGRSSISGKTPLPAEASPGP